MFRNYLTIAIRNLLRHRMYSAINILGLAVGLTCSTLILLYLQHEFSYDRHHTKADRIYRVIAAKRLSDGDISYPYAAQGPVAPALAEDFPEIERTTRFYRRTVAIRVENKLHFRNEAIVADQDFFNIFDYPLVEGNVQTGLQPPFSIFITQTLARRLFGNEDPIGRFDRINRINFNIVGVLEEQGAMGWRNYDDQVYIPVKTAMYRLMGKDYVNYFDVQVGDMDDMSYVSTQIVDELLKSHRLAETDRQSFEVINMAEIQAAATGMIATLAYLLGSVAAVSLLVGGIGIMNIMLVMVMERTHEIGLRKALGAQRGDILTQFLVEAVLICSFGGIVGILLGAGISWLLSSIAQWVIFISPGSIILAFTFSVLIGIVFGMWPAWRASKLLPIVALRYE